MWTVANDTPNTVMVNDIPGPVQILPYTNADFEYQDVLNSKTIASNLTTGGLCVVSFGDFAAINGKFLPVTYKLHQNATEIENGNSNPFTVAPFDSLYLMLNVTALNPGSTIVLSMEYYDGTVYYPSTQVLPSSGNISAVGQYVAQITPVGMAARFLWAISGSVTFTLIGQLRD